MMARMAATEACAGDPDSLSFSLDVHVASRAELGKLEFAMPVDTMGHGLTSQTRLRIW